MKKVILPVLVLVLLSIGFSQTISLGAYPSVINITSRIHHINITLFNMNCNSDAYFIVYPSSRLYFSSAGFDKDILVKCKTFINNGTVITIGISTIIPNGIHQIYIEGRPVNVTKNVTGVGIKPRIAVNLNVCIPNNGNCSAIWYRTTSPTYPYSPSHTGQPSTSGVNVQGQTNQTNQTNQTGQSGQNVSESNVYTGSSDVMTPTGEVIAVPTKEVFSKEKSFLNDIAPIIIIAIILIGAFIIAIMLP